MIDYKRVSLSITNQDNYTINKYVKMFNLKLKNKVLITHFYNIINKQANILIFEDKIEKRFISLCFLKLFDNLKVLFEIIPNYIYIS